jgi:hypothetical protein
MAKVVLHLLHVGPTGEQQAGTLVAQLVNREPRHV